MGGPGERQIESDKRQLNKRINKIKIELKKIEFNKLIIHIISRYELYIGVADNNNIFIFIGIIRLSNGSN